VFESAKSVNLTPSTTVSRKGRKSHPKLSRASSLFTKWGLSKGERL